MQVCLTTGLDTWAQVAQVVIAFFTVILAAIAIWGETIRRRLFPPNLVLSEHNFEGDFVTMQGGKRHVYYHLKIVNTHKWSPAQKVRVLFEAYSRRKADGVTFQQESLVIPIQLYWSFIKFHELLPAVGPDRYIDIGYLVEGEDYFYVSLLTIPGNFNGFVRAKETLRFKIVATADNLTKTEPLYLEVSWDGEFHFDKEEMLKHLVIKKVNSLG